MTTPRTDHRDAARSWRIGSTPGVHGTFAGQTPPPPSIPQKRILSDKELKAKAAGRSIGLARGYLVGLFVGLPLGAVSTLFFIALREGLWK